MLSLRFLRLLITLIPFSLIGFPYQAQAQLSADFSANNTTGCLTVVATFTDLSTGNPTGWTWNFYQGGSLIDTRTSQNPGKIFNQPGCYDVELIVVDNAGGRDTLRRNCYIEVFRNPSPAFTASDTLGCSPASIQFTNQTIPNAAGLDSCTWVFRNQSNLTSFSSIARDPLVTFTDTGIYDIQLKCTNTNGCDTTILVSSFIRILPSPTANFTIAGGLECAFPVILNFTNNSSTNGAPNVTYQWGFAGGTPPASNAFTPPPISYNTAGTFPMALAVVSSSGCGDTLVIAQNIGIQTFNVGFTISDTMPCANSAVNFADTTTLPAGSTRLWDFGDNNTAVLPNITHTYTMAGTYTVKLVVTTPLGCSDSTTRTVTVLPRPTVNFGVSPGASCDTNTVFMFSDSSSPGVSWLWNFGDGSTSTLQNPSHVYNALGDYTVCLRVTDANGCGFTRCEPAFVRLGSPTANFAADAFTGCVPFTANFSDSTISPDSIISWNWTFGDGTGTGVSPGTSTLQNPTVTVTQPGVYNVTLIIATLNGCADTVTITNYLRGGTLPMVDFTVDEDSLCVNQSVTFTSTFTDPAYIYYWDQQHSSTFSVQGPVFQTAYGDTGCFNIALAIDNNGCRDTVIKDSFVCVFPPVADFSVNRGAVCVTPSTIQVTDNSTGPITSYQWFFNNSLVSTSPNFNTLNIPAGLPQGAYPFILIVENSNTGCADTAASLIFVGDPQADFNISNGAGCKDLLVSFNNLTNPNNQFTWNFGDGSAPSTVPNPTHTYTDTGFFTVSLITFDPATGCRDTLTKVDSIRVDGPYTNFSGVNIAGCAPMLSSFTDLSVTSGGANINNWEWHFGDINNTSSPLQNPTFQYDSAGLFTVSLKIIDSNGCEDSLAIPNFVSVARPRARFTADTDTTCLGGPVNFINNSLWGTLTSLWIFGPLPTDTSLQNDPTWAFADTGYQNVSLIVTDVLGCSDTITRDSIVYVETMVLDFSATPMVGTCPPLDVSFTNLTTGNVDSVIWNFGDGTFSTQNDPRHIYTLPGCYDVTLITIHDRGCRDTLVRPCFIDIAGPSAQMTFSPAEPCFGDSVTFTIVTDSASDVFLDPDDGPLFSFSFGQNTSDTVVFKKLYSSAGTFNPVLVVENSQGCQVRLPSAGSILVHNLPTANFTPSSFTGCAPFAVNFTDTSVPGDTSINTWIWDFGTGDSAFIQNPAYTFQNVGLFTTTLLVVDENGCQNSFSSTLEANPSPIADFVASDTFSCAPATLDFTDLSSNTVINQWLWVFGDGDSTVGTGTPRHTYLQDSVYDVTLYVTDVNGCSDTLTKSQYIQLRHPTAFVYPTDPIGCAPATVMLYADSSGFFSDTTLASYTWRVRTQGGPLRVVSGAVGSTVDSLGQPYTVAGNYDFQLIVTDIFGCQDTLSDTISVFNPPQAVLDVSDLEGCAPHVVTFGDSSVAGDSNIGSWIWDFGNGDSSLVQHPGYIYMNPGQFSVKLTVIDGNGCSDTDSLLVEAFDRPNADFMASDTFNCSPTAVQFTDLSSNTPVVDWRWYFGDGDSAISVANPNHTYLADGLYDVSLIAIDGNGCSDTLTKASYINMRHPTAMVYALDQFGCNPVTITLFADSSDLLSDTTLVSYTWIVETSSGVNPPITTTIDSLDQEYQQPGIYDVSLVVTDIFGCTDTIVRPDYIEVKETTVPIPMDIQYVSVLADNRVEVVYDQWPDPVGFLQYLIYWLNPATNTYEVLDSVSNITQTQFIHQTASLNTEDNSYCYKVIIQNNCLQYGDLDSTNEHCTVLLTTTSDIDMIRLDWNSYVGWNPVAYEVYRVSDYNPATSALIATVPGGDLFYEDPETFCSDSNYYRVRALRDLGGLIASWSDRDGEIPIHPEPSEQVDMTHASVFGDSIVDLLWGSYAGYLPTRYILDRSKDGQTWKNLDTLGLSTQTYFDEKVEVDEQSYYYRISVLDTCGDISPFGLYGKTILLEADQDGKYPLLNWTPYLLWPNGVLKYDIEVYNPDLGQFEFVAVVPGNVTTYIDDETFLPGGEYCYRIRATEAGGQSAEALSNVDCTIFSPKVFAPNAFSPNSDGYNDRFFVSAPNAQEITLSIFGRWGELLYTSSNLAEGWDGTFKGRSVPEGVYVFHLKGTGADGSKIEVSGSITLIR